jgi:hypothetical protein
LAAGDLSLELEGLREARRVNKEREMNEVYDKVAKYRSEQ